MRRIILTLIALMFFSSFVFALPNQQYPNSFFDDEILCYHLNESSGTNASDSCNNNHGTAANIETADWFPALIANGLRLDGVNEDVDTGITLGTSSSFSVSTWINYTDSFQPFGWHSGGIGFYMTGSFTIECGDGNFDAKNSRFTWSPSPAPGDGNWHHIVITKKSGLCTSEKFRLYVDGVNQSEPSVVRNNADQNYTSTTFRIGGNGGGVYKNADYDEFLLFSQELTSGQVATLNLTNYTGGGSIPVLTAINCTSCNSPQGDSVSPYTSADTTPTFTFNTDINSECRIGGEDQNFTTMGASRDCGTTGVQSHICTLTVQDELISSTDYVYIGCTAENSTSSSGALEMDIQNLSSTVADGIDLGIQTSKIWPGATIYTDQKVYLRDLNNNQLVTTVDKIAVYGNQRWLINNAIDGASVLGLFNITPAVYTLDAVNESSSEMANKVSALINSTKS